jgi:chromosome segregation ATPase
MQLGVFAERLASEAQSSAVVSRLTSEKKALSHELERSRADSSDLARRLEAAEAESRRLLALLAESNKERESLCREVRELKASEVETYSEEGHKRDLFSTTKELDDAQEPNASVKGGHSRGGGGPAYRHQG